MKSDTSSEIKRIAREIYNPIASLNSLNRDASLGSDLIVHFTLNHIDLNIVKNGKDILATVSFHPQWSNSRPFFKVKPSL